MMCFADSITSAKKHVSSLNVSLQSQKNAHVYCIRFAFFQNLCFELSHNVTVVLDTQKMELLGMRTVPEKYLFTEACYRSMSARRHGVPAYEDFGCGFIYGGRSARDILFRRYGLVYVLHGSGVYTDWHGKEYPLFPGCVAQRLPAKTHATVFDEPAEWGECWLTISTSLYLPLAEMGVINADKPVLYPGLDFSLVARFETLLHDMQVAADADVSQLLPRIFSLITTIYARDRHAGRDERVEAMLLAAQDVLAGNLDEDVDMQELAARFHLSYERFRKVFTQACGCSPGLFRIRKRIEAACVLLSRDRMAVKLVAAQLGYPDAFTFSRQFRKMVGVSPSEFRDNR